MHFFLVLAVFHKEQEIMKLLVSFIVTIVVVTLLCLDGVLADPFDGSRRRLKGGKGKGGKGGKEGKGKGKGGKGKSGKGKSGKGKNKGERGEERGGERGGVCKKVGLSCELGECCPGYYCAGPNELTCQAISIPPIP